MDDWDPFFLCGSFEMDAATDRGDEGMNGVGDGSSSRGTSKVRGKEIHICSGIF